MNKAHAYINPCEVSKGSVKNFRMSCAYKVPTLFFIIVVLEWMKSKLEMRNAKNNPRNPKKIIYIFRPASKHMWSFNRISWNSR